MTPSNMDRYFRGDALYGDDFGPEEMKAWYQAEMEGYASLDFDEAKAPSYSYHELGQQTAFSYLPANRRFASALGIGSAFAEEFEPIRDRVESLVVLDPSTSFSRDTVHGIPVRYQQPDPSGRMSFDDASFDLITCFGTLHHVSNVSCVVNEVFRVLRPGGYALVREPIISMGDWRLPRSGLTRNERGIPLSVFRKIVNCAGFEVVAEHLTTFGPLSILSRKLKLPTFNSPTLTRLDLAMCRLFSSNIRYHRQTVWEKVGPTGVAYVLHKP